MKRVFACLLSIFLSAYAGAEDAKPYDFPSERFLVITGTIDTHVQYFAHISYATTSPDSSCKQRIYGAGVTVQRSTELVYEPSISGNRHSIKIPLKAYAADTPCQWLPRDIRFCYGPRAAGKKPQSCDSVLKITDGEASGNPFSNIVCNGQWICLRRPAKLGIERVHGQGESYIINIDYQPLETNSTVRELP